MGSVVVVPIVTAVIAACGGVIAAGWLNRRKTAAEAKGLEAAAEQTVEGARIERALAVQEKVLEGVQQELDRQRALREQDRKDFTTEVGVWASRSAKCDEALAAEIRAREHEKILARERDTSIADLQRELTLALSDLARLSKRADEEDRRARDVVAASAAADLLKQAGIDVDVIARLKEVQGAVEDVKHEVTTGNDQSLARLADLAERRRIEEIPPAERTVEETGHMTETDP